MAKEIQRKQKMIVRLDVVDEDELMACSRGRGKVGFSIVGKSELWEGSDLYNKMTDDGSRNSCPTVYVKE